MRVSRPKPQGLERLALGEYESDGERRVGVADPFATDAERAAAGVETYAAAERRLRAANRRRAKSSWEARTSPLPEDAQVRRVWRARPVAELRKRLGSKDAVVWADGDMLELLYRGAAERVDCSAGIQMAMWRVGRSDLWELSVRVARLEEAVMSLIPFPLRAGEGVYGRTMGQTPLDFRGARAPAAPAEIDCGPQLVRGQLDGPGIGGPRDVCAWRPASARGELPVLYCADLAATMLVRTVGAAIEAGELPPVLLVGIESGHLQGSVDRRAQEYLPGYSRRRFAAHERFVLEQVLPWAEREHGAARAATRRFTCGFSNGATWALAMAQRHPAVFGGAAAFSVAWHPPRRALHHAGQRYALCAGTLEPGFASTTAAWAAALRRGPATHVAHCERVAGHDPRLWLEQAPWAVDILVW